jgi:hypothetical protein
VLELSRNSRRPIILPQYHILTWSECHWERLGYVAVSCECQITCSGQHSWRCQRRMATSGSDKLTKLVQSVRSRCAEVMQHRGGYIRNWDVYVQWSATNSLVFLQEFHDVQSDQILRSLVLT